MKLLEKIYVFFYTKFGFCMFYIGSTSLFLSGYIISLFIPCDFISSMKPDDRFGATMGLMFFVLIPLAWFIGCILTILHEMIFDKIVDNWFERQPEETKNCIIILEKGFWKNKDWKITAFWKWYFKN